MASSNRDKTIEDNKQTYKKTPKPLSYLPDCLEKFQENINQGRTPSPPRINPVHNQQEAEYNVLDEINRIRQLIKDNGHQGDFGTQIKFGDLIPIYGTAQIDKLTEILAIARKNGYINYTLKDFLRQNRDENVYIRLIQKIR